MTQEGLGGGRPAGAAQDEQADEPSLQGQPVRVKAGGGQAKAVGGGGVGQGPRTLSAWTEPSSPPGWGRDDTWAHLEL